MERNASVPTKLPVINDTNDIKLCSKAMIKANGYLFKSVFALSKYVETFNFDENCLIV